MKETTMKKLMIAAAVAAMIGGAYAGDEGECIACQNNPEQQVGSWDSAFYNIQFKLTTLATKTLKCKADCDYCEDSVTYYYEDGKRTIDGIVFTCDKCEDNAVFTCLWEKKYQTCLMPVQWDAYSEITNAQWKAEGTIRAYFSSGADFYNWLEEEREWEGGPIAGHWGAWTATGDSKVAVAQPQGESERGYETRWVKGDFAYHSDADYADIPFETPVFDSKAEVLAYVTSKTAQELLGEDVVVVCDSMAVRGYQVVPADPSIDPYGSDKWYTDLPFADFYRYGKKAAKVATGVWGISAADNNGSDYALDFEATAVAFGSFDTKKKVIKSLKGGFAGLYTADYIDGECECGQYLDPCDDFTNWCEIGYQGEETIPCYGTWTLKYNAALMKKSMYKIVPSYCIANED